MLSLLDQNTVNKRISNALQLRIDQGRYRQLTILEAEIDFRSNDYLGLSQSAWIKNELKKLNNRNLGSTGSRLLSGNSKIHLETEQFLADHYQSEAALIFNSGFDANVGLLSTVIRPCDLVFYDEAIHASMHQGLKLAGAELHAFSHNNTTNLQQLLEQFHTDRIVWIVCESYYSMDGDKAPLVDFVELAQKYSAQIIVDEAHAVGCFGENGRGLCDENDISEQIFARVVTFGKALGAHGAAVLCDLATQQYLINFCKTFIYTTALPVHDIQHIKIAHLFLQKFHQAQKKLEQNIQYFHQKTRGLSSLKGDGPVYGFVIPGEIKVKHIAQQLQNKGIAIQAIVAPTIPIGEEMLRINLHSFNSIQEIDILINSLHQLYHE
ncbi:MAG TPA: pyridoxal phosphate-dependent aminotransferase family protein [Chitinophagales bacterium]|nr:pyridoxal phosphate-dependent aminotransferase family protein [Chitinophagales bacterium]